MDSKVMSLLRQRKMESDYVIGYTEYELKKIESLYNIIIEGQLREFMLLAGRCDGGLIGDDPIILYRPSWDVRTQIIFQLILFDDLQDIGAFDYIEKNFCFSLEYETQNYYLITGKQDNLVYHYDSNEKKTECTNMTFYEYLDDVYKRYVEETDKEQIICRGELLEIYV